MMRSSVSLVLALCVGCASQAPNSRDDRSGASSPELVEARRKLDAGDPDGALLITDRLLETHPDHREARVLAARGNLALFRSGRQGAAFFLDDAVTNLEAALRSDSDDPETLLLLSECQLQRSEFEAGYASAMQAVRLFGEQGAPHERVAAALLQAADHRLQQLADVRREEMQAAVERPGDEAVRLADEALVALNAAERHGAIAAARRKSAQIYQWMGQNSEALDVLEGGIRLDPGAFELHDEFLRQHIALDMRRECVTAYRRLLAEAPGNTALLWSLGKAQVAVGDDLRFRSDWDGAAEAYAKAAETYRHYDETRPQDHAQTAQWIAICELSLGRVDFERGRFAEAEAHYTAAFEACPLVAETNEDGTPTVFDTFGGNYLGGLNMIGLALGQSTRPDALEQSLAFFERVLERHPDRFGALYNNAALSARDLGARIARDAEGEDRAARMAEAMALWEKSYGFYEKAVELEPEDPRILNDCGLMLVYHLHRDYDRARELFDRAREFGQQALDELPMDAPEEQRHDVEEATGDAWQNIGVLLEDNLERPFEEARPFYEKAVEYYPYQRRDAARRLRNASSGAAEASAPVQDERAKKFAREIEPVKQLAAAGDWDGALLALDRMTAEMSGHAPFHWYFGTWSLQYAEKAAAEGQAAGLVDGLFNDAVRHLQRAVELDGEPVEPRLALAKALLATGENQAAADTAESLLSHARSIGGAEPDVLHQAHAVRAQAATRAYIAAKQAGEEPDEALLRGARASFREIEATDAYDASLRAVWTALEQWAGAPEQAVAVLRRAFEKDRSLVGEFVQLGASTGTSAAVVEALEGTEDATELWWLGRARFDLGVQHWSNGKTDEAVAVLDAAVTAFERSAAANADYRDSSEQWIALTLGQKGLVQVSAGDHRAAEASLLAALERRPDMLTTDLGGGSTIKRGILLAGEPYRLANELGALVELYRKAHALAPDDVDFANNLGLFARDHAQRVARSDAEAAEELYEISYAAYTRATELDPENIRLRNDRALILVYYLEREPELAEELLRASIADGGRQLAEEAPEDPDELRNLQEAVGDAYGNLGYLQLQRGELEEARENLTKSLEFYPFRQRAGVRLLERLEKEAADRDGGTDTGRDGR